MSRYNDLDYVMGLSFEDGIRIINKAREKEAETKLWNLYTAVYPNMDKDNFISFEDFKRESTEIVEAKTPQQVIEETRALYYS